MTGFKKARFLVHKYFALRISICVIGYGQYLFMVPVVATVDLDAKDAYLVEEGDAFPAFNCSFSFSFPLFLAGKEKGFRKRGKKVK